MSFLKTLNGYMYVVSGAILVGITLCAIVFHSYSLSLQHDIVDVCLLSKTQASISQVKSNVLLMLLMSGKKNTALASAKTDAEKSMISKSYDNKIRKIAEKSIPDFNNSRYALEGYDKGFRTVGVNRIFGVNKSDISKSAVVNSGNAKLFKRLDAKYAEFSNAIAGFLKHPVSFSGTISPSDFSSRTDSMISGINSLNDGLRNTFSEKIILMVTLTIIIPLAFLIGFIVLIFYFKKTVVDVLSAVSRMVKKLAAGDLTPMLDIKSPYSEINNLSSGVNEMNGELKKNIRSIGGVASKLSAHSGDMSSISGGFKNICGTIDEQSEGIAEAVKQMSIAIIEVAKNASASAQKAAGTQNAVKDGTSAAHEVTVKISNTANTMSELSTTVSEFEKSSAKISEIVSVINDIADQTNLLALNAAIEAARAGEHGRGFAVVADEVRKLAERTQKATKEITGMITGIQSNMSNAVSGIQKGLTDVAATEDSVRKTSDIINNIKEFMSELNESITQIATATEEQSQVSEEISTSTGSIIKAQEELLAGADKVKSGSGELLELSAELLKIISRFAV